ncbi:MAG: WD40 repeat domain-containing protein [Gemmataceae bacterium]
MLQLIGHQGTVHALLFSPDGQTLFSAGKDQSVRVWDVGRAVQRAELIGHTGTVLCLALHSNGRILASGGADGVPRLWDAKTATPHENVEAQWAAVTGLGWLPNKNTLLVASGERMRPEKAGELKAYHFGSAPPPNLRRVDPFGIWSLAVATGTPTMAWGGGSRGIWAWDVTKPEPKLLKQNTTSLAVAVSPDGKYVAAASDWTVRLWDAARGRELTTLAGHRGQVTALAFSPDGRTLASGSRDKVVRFWSIDEGAAVPRRSYEWPAGAVYALAFSSDGLLAAVAGDAGSLIVWDVDE